MANLLDAMSRWMRSPAFKFALIAFLILVLLIPLVMVGLLVYERQSRSYEVVREINRIWGPEQHLTGPLLVVPYTVRREVLQGDKRIEQIDERRAIFTPQRLDVTGSVEAKTLRRSIFEVPVYASRLKLSGRFEAPRMADVVADTATIRWRDAIFVLGLSGVSGLKDAASLKIEGAKDVAFAPSLGLPGQASTPGIHARLADAGAAVLAPDDKPIAAFDFTVDLTFNGSVALEIAPVARETRVALTSTWPHPSFSGAFLPDERRITSQGFSASWKVPHLARSVPEAWILDQTGLNAFSPFGFGVRLVSPVDFYNLVTRATKYGVMFLALVFMAVFASELTAATSVHPVQYLFTGLALVFFFVLLLSFAEHIGFARAYLFAATATSVMLATYIGAVFRSRRQGAIMFGVIAVTYLLIYFILQLEDYALLVGALLGFVALTAVMFATLRIDWSRAREIESRPSI